MITKNKIDYSKILERGYTLNEEYESLDKNGTLRKFRIGPPDVETFWVYDISHPNLFVMANDPIPFWGAPRSVVGLLGWFDSGTMNEEKSLESFKKAGQEAIDYFHKKVKEATKEVDNPEP